MGRHDGGSDGGAGGAGAAASSGGDIELVGSCRGDGGVLTSRWRWDEAARATSQMLVADGRGWSGRVTHVVRTVADSKPKPCGFLAVPCTELNRTVWPTFFVSVAETLRGDHIVRMQIHSDQ
jgi:hypothetical protein